MYNIKGPSKIVAKTTRRGISQSMDNMRDYNRNRSYDNEESESPINGPPKPIFQKKIGNHTSRQETISPQHEELINYINDSWNTVCSELYQSTERKIENTDKSVVFYEEEPCIYLNDFKPFDLESWWGKRLYAYVTGSVNNNNKN